MKGWYYRLMADARWIVAFLVLWSVLFIGVYLPFDRRIEQMDQPLERAWERLSQSIQTNRLGSLWHLIDWISLLKTWTSLSPVSWTLRPN